MHIGPQQCPTCFHPLLDLSYVSQVQSEFAVASVHCPQGDLPVLPWLGLFWPATVLPMAWENFQWNQVLKSLKAPLVVAVLVLLPMYAPRCGKAEHASVS